MIYICIALIAIMNIFQAYGVFIACDFVMQILFSVIVFKVFSNTDPEKIIEKSLWFLLFAYQIIGNCFFYWIELDGLLGYLVYAFELSSFVAILLYYSKRKFIIESDTYREGATFIAVKRPKHIFSFILCAFCPVVGGMSLIADGKIGWYEKNTKVYKVSNIRDTFLELDNYKLIRINLPTALVKSHFLIHEGQEFSALYSNCFNSILYMFPGYRSFFRTPYGLIKYILRERAL